MLNRVAVDAFGVDPNSLQSKNRKAREVIKRARKVVEAVNKSGQLKEKHNELLVAKIGRAWKLTNNPVHRWTAVGGTIQDLLIQRVILEKSFRAVKKKDLLIKNDWPVLEQFHAVFSAMLLVSQKAQMVKRVPGPEAYMRLLNMYQTICDQSQPLTVKTFPSPSAALLAKGDGAVNKKVQVRDLAKETTTVRILASEGLFKRIFIRFHPIKAFTLPGRFFGSNKSLTNATFDDLKHDYVFDMMLLLRPRYRNGKVIRSMCKHVGESDFDQDDIPRGCTDSRKVLYQRHGEFLLSTLWGKITQFGELAAQDILDKEESDRDDDHAAAQPESPPKRQRTSAEERDGMEALGLSSPDITVASSPGGSQNPASVTARGMIDKEIAFFRDTDNRMFKDIDHQRGKDDKDTFGRELLNDWQRKGMRDTYPLLYIVVSALCGMLPGSGALECDIGAFKRVIRPERSSLKAGYVEAEMMIMLNRPLVALDIQQFPELGDNWERSIPSRPAYPYNFFEEDILEQDSDLEDNGNVLLEDDDSDSDGD
jgi:hypothetical protein